MSRIRQSFAWWCFAGKAPAETLIRESIRIGYKGVEMIPQENWQEARDAGLQIATLGGHRSLSDGLNRRENHERIQREIEQNLEIAARWSIPVLIVFSGNRAGLDDKTGAQITAEGLRRVAGSAESAGVTLALELLNSKVDHDDYQCDRTCWGVEVCKLVDSPRVKLLYDIYHMQIMEGDVIRSIRDNIQRIGHFHTAGNPGRHELDETQELYYPAIMRAISELPYDGYVGQEFTPTGDAIQSLEAAFRVCDVGG